MMHSGRGSIAVVFAVGVLLAVVVEARADLRCGAEVDRTQVAAGGQVVLTMRAETDAGRQPTHEPPVIDGVEVVPGGTSQSFQLVNGRSEYSVDITYYLVVRRTTDFRIPAVVFAAGGATCQTRPLAVTVSGTQRTPAGPGPGQTAPPAADREPSGGSGQQAGKPGDQYFITLSVDRQEVWLGEQVQLVFRYYHRRSAWSQPSYTPPRTEGFWRVDLPPERNYRRSVGGNVYDVTEIRYALFPTRSGELIVDAARIEIGGDPFQRFFGRQRRGPLRLLTEPITVRVNELPLPRPATFSGIVADQLEFTATVDRDTVPRGEPVSLRLQLGADGFLKSFGGVPLAEADGLQIHDAAEHLREDVTGPRYRTTFTQEKAVVPTREGVVSFPPLEVTFFDSGKGRYETVSAAVADLVVIPSDLPVLGDDPSGFRRTEIARLGNDLAFIHQDEGRLAGRPRLRFGSVLWWALALTPWLVLAAYRAYLRRAAAARRDPLGVRRRGALATAKRRLEKAAANGDADLLARAILGFVADRTGRAAAGLSATDVRIWAESIGRKEEGHRLASVLDASDGARFGGGANVDVAELASGVRAVLPHLVASAEPGKAGMSGTAGALVLTLVLGLSVSPAMAQPGRGPAPGVDPARLVAEGHEAYTAGDLDLALARYREARNLGVDAASLHYNLGNTQARRGELGHAIVSYLRAQRRDPRDEDIRRNLAWVRSHTADLELAGQPLPPVVAQLDRAAHLLAVDDWGLVLVVLVWAWVFAVAWSWRRGFLDGGLRRLVIGLAGVLVATAAITATRVYEERVRNTAVVIVDEVEVRSGPATTFPVVFQVHDGLTVTVRGKRDGWRRIALGGDWGGWVPSGQLEEVRWTGNRQGR